MNYNIKNKGNKNMEQKILGINTEFESLEYPGFGEVAYKDSIAFFGYDAVIVDSSNIANCYDCGLSNKTYKNKRLLSQDASCEIIEDSKRIKEQLVELLNEGKNVFVLLGHNENCFIYTGETKYNGTGKNAKRTDIVTEFDTYSFLPIDLSITNVCGENFELCCNLPYKNFFIKTNETFQYESYFNTPTGTPLMKAKGSSKIISAVVEYAKGKIIFLPHPYYEDDYIEYFEEEKSWEEYGRKYLEGIFELNEQLCTSNDEYILPKWANNFSILNEKEEQKILGELIEQQEILNKKIAKQDIKIKELLKYKALITSSGEILENIVKQVLSELGFSLKETIPGRTDVIAKYGRKDIVIEIKGVTKSAAEKHAAQLEKWVSLFIEENEKSPKPLLIVNAYCDLPITERTEDTFPKQMLKYCTVRGHALISTIQLLCLFIDIKNNPSCKKERIKELLETEGIYNRYINLDDYLINK